MIILGLHATNADHKCDYFSILWAPRSAKLSGKVLSGIVGRWRSQRCIIHPSSDEVDHKAHESLRASKKKEAKLSIWGPCVLSLDVENHAIEREGITPIKIMLELSSVSPGVVQCVRRSAAKFR